MPALHSFSLPQPCNPQLIPQGSIDLLASKVVFTNQSYDISSRSQRGRSTHLRQFGTGQRDEEAFPTNQHTVEVHGGAVGSGYGRTSSQERIIRAKSIGTAASDADMEVVDARRVGISKTVEFEVEVSESRIKTRSPLG